MGCNLPVEISSCKDALESPVSDLLPIDEWDDESTQRFKEVLNEQHRSGFANLSPVLPALFNLNGFPLTLKDHFPLEPLFATRVPPTLTLKGSRQIGKTEMLRVRLLSRCALSKDHHVTLVVTPLGEMIKRFSHGLTVILEDSPVRSLLLGPGAINNVLHKQFLNRSQLFFSFAFLDCTRIRGVPARDNLIEEAQDIDPDFLPIIHETMSAAPYPTKIYSGTPLTMEGTLQRCWNESSQAEWVIKCHHGGCGHWNIPAMGYDLDGMIGDFREDISEEEPGVVCAKCRKSLRPRTGRYVHARPERRFIHPGIHIPQIIMPVHYSSPTKWGELLAKRAGHWNFTPAKFYNEVLGESCDSGAKLVTLEELHAAAILPWENKLDQVLERSNFNDYIYRCFCVDWGGGGEKQDSFTVMAVVGLRANGKIDVLYAEKSFTPLAHIKEAKRCLELFKRFRCHYFAHDATGAGALRETFMVHSGLNKRCIVPMVIQRTLPGRPIITFHEETDVVPRSYYLLDKTRSLLTTCAAIQTGFLRFFKDDWKSDEEPGLLRDWMALIEDKTDSKYGSDLYAVMRHPHRSDDFAQAVNMGCCALWTKARAWPKFTVA